MADLHTYVLNAGVPLQLRSSSPAFVHLITPALAVMNLKIVCERCKQWTNNGWAANIGLATDILPEVPPEGDFSSCCPPSRVNKCSVCEMC